MMRFYLMIVFLTIYCGLNAQREFAPLGATWHYNTDAVMFGIDKCTTYISDSDTIVEGKSCRIINKYLSDNIAFKDSIIIRQEDNKVYYYFDNKFNLLYDFGVKVGDTVQFTFKYDYYPHNYENGYDDKKDTLFSARYVFNRVEYVVVDGVNVKLFNARICQDDHNDNPFFPDIYPFAYTYYEMFGCEFGLITTVNNNDDPSGETFRCYSDNDMSIVSDQWNEYPLPCDYSYEHEEESRMFISSDSQWYYTEDIVYSPVSKCTKYKEESFDFAGGLLCNLVKRYADDGKTLKDTIFFRQFGDQLFYYSNNKFNLLFDFGAKIGDTVKFSFKYEYYPSGSSEYIDTLFAARYVVSSKNDTIIEGLKSKMITAEICSQDIDNDYDGLLVYPAVYQYSDILGYKYGFMPIVNNKGIIKLDRLRCYSDKDMSLVSDWWQEKSLPCNYSKPNDAEFIIDSSNINVYPNPVGNTLYVSSDMEIDLIVRDAIGRIIYNGNALNGVIEVPMYKVNTKLVFIEIRYNDNYLLTRKIIKR